jgi:putative endonuclease
VVVREAGGLVAGVRFSLLRLSKIKFMWYTYVLESINNQHLYTGYTDDLRRRLKEHNEGRGGEYTKIHGKWKLIFYEAYSEKKDAAKAEKFFKSGYGKEVLKDKLENYFKNKCKAAASSAARH